MKRFLSLFPYRVEVTEMMTVAVNMKTLSYPFIGCVKKLFAVRFGRKEATSRLHSNEDHF